MDFTSCLKVIGRAYNGANGKKIAVSYNGETYMLKFPPAPNQTRSELSYTNSCISEYLCCHIFELLGIPVQQTLLGTYSVNGKEKIVCACKDFTSDTVSFFDFCSIKNTIIDSELNGKGTDINEVLETISLQQYVDPQKLSDFFFDVFIADALVGNFDRHNGNWGFLFDRTSQKYEIAPVYDCGSCLLPQADDEMLRSIMADRGEFNSRIYNYPLSAIYHGGKKINYHSFINSLEFKECNQALLRIAPRIDTEKINALVDETPYISDVQRTFYKAFIGARFEKIIAPAYKKVLAMNEEITQNSDMDFGMKM